MGDEGKLDYNLTVKVNEGYNASSELLRSFGDDSRLVAMLAESSTNGIALSQENISQVGKNLSELSKKMETSPTYLTYTQLCLISTLYEGDSDSPTPLLDPSFPVAVGYFTDSSEGFSCVLTPGATIIRGRKGEEGVEIYMQEYVERTGGLDNIISGSIDVQEGDVLLLTTDEVVKFIGEERILSGLLSLSYDRPERINSTLITTVYQNSRQEINREDIPLVVIKVGEIGYQDTVVLEDVTDTTVDLLSGVPISTTHREGYLHPVVDNSVMDLSLDPDDSQDDLGDAPNLEELGAEISDNTARPLPDELEALLPLAATLVGERYDGGDDEQTKTGDYKPVPDLERTDEHHAVVVNDLDIDTDDDIPVDARTWDLADETHAHDPPGLRDSAFPTQLDRQYAVLERSLERISQERDRFHSRAEEAEDLLAEAQGSLRSLGEQYKQLETNRDQWEEGYRGLDIDLTALEGDYKSLEAQLADKDKELTNVQIKLARYKEERRLRINLLPKRKSLIRRLGSALTTSLDYITKPLLNKSRFKLFVGIDAILIGAALAASVAVNGTYQPVLDHAEAFKYELQSRHVINTHPLGAPCNDARTQFKLLEQGVSQEVRATKAFDRAQDLKSRFLESIDCE